MDDVVAAEAAALPVGSMSEEDEEGKSRFTESVGADRAHVA